MAFYGDLIGKQINILFKHTYGKNRKRLLLVREPCDILVSLYFQYKYRVPTRRKRAVDYSNMKSFIRSRHGAEQLSRYWNKWLAASAERLEIKYEDLFNCIWEEILEWFKIEIKKDLILKADELCKFDNIRKNLHSLPPEWSSGLMKKFLAYENHGITAHPKNPETHKFRQGIVGGYTNYLDESDVEYIRSRVPEAARWYSGY